MRCSVCYDKANHIFHPSPFRTWHLCHAHHKEVRKGSTEAESARIVEALHKKFVDRKIAFNEAVRRHRIKKYNA